MSKVVTVERDKKKTLTTWFKRDDWNERILTFNASWFTASMSTAITGQVFFTFAYPTQWLVSIGHCLWVLAIVLLLFFTLLFAIRACKHPHLMRQMLRDFYQTSFLGAVPITVAVIASGLVEFYGQYSGAVWFAYALFWVAVALCVVVGGIFVFLVSAIQDPPKLESVNGVWLLTFIPFLVTSAAGSTLIPALPSHLKGSTHVLSFFLWSIGTSFSMVILAIYFWRLMHSKLPMRETIATAFIPVGPGGMAAYVIQNLAVSLSEYVQSTSFNLGQEEPPPAYRDRTTPEGIAYRLAVGESIHWIGVITATFLLAFSTFWLLQAVFSVLWRVPKTFNVGFWGFVFPNGVYTLGLSRLVLELDNKGLRGWAATMGVVTILLWCGVAGGTVYKGVWRGELFFAPGLEGWNERKALEETQRMKLNSVTTQSQPQSQSQSESQDVQTQDDDEQTAAYLDDLEKSTDINSKVSTDENVAVRSSQMDGTYKLTKVKRAWRKPEQDV